MRLVIILPVLITVVGILLIAAKLAGQVNKIDESPARDYPPNPLRGVGTPGRLLQPRAGRANGPPQSADPKVTNALVVAPLIAVRSPPLVVVPASPVALPSVAASEPRSVPLVTDGAASAVVGLLGSGIVGRVFLRGTPLPEQEVPMDPSCGKARADHPKLTTRFFVMGTNGGLADVFVGLKGLPAGQRELPASPVEIRQRGCEYLPYVSAVQVDQSIRVFNDDPLMHNVHPTPAHEGNREQNRAQLPKGAPLDFVFPKPEALLRFKCDVHPWMFAYVTVVEHPFFAVSAVDGQFALPEPPAGIYTLQFLHRKAGEKLVPVSVRPGKRLLVIVTLDLADPLKHEAVVTEE